MHYSHVVAIPGIIAEEMLSDELARRMSFFNECDDECISPVWDWWVVGGRWGASWTLRDGSPQGPLATEPSSFGFTEDFETNPAATDCARWKDIVPESVDYPYSWLDTDMLWHTKWIGPELSGSKEYKDWERGTEHDEEFMKFLANLDPQTWLVHVDYHG